MTLASLRRKPLNTFPTAQRLLSKPVKPEMDHSADDEIVVEIYPTIRTYRSGRIERLQPTDFVSASLDISTGVCSKDVLINPSTGLSARIYRPPPPASSSSSSSSSSTARQKYPVFLYYHGGGFCCGSAFCSVYHSFLNSLSSIAGVIAISVNFRLAPEHPLPIGYDDSWEALQWVTTEAYERGPLKPWLAEYADLNKIFLAGDSSGANIAHNVAIRLGQSGSEVEGLVLMHPLFWGKERIGSEEDEVEGVLLKIKDANALWPFVCPGTIGLDDPRMNPTAEGAPSLAALGCRRLQVSVGGIDLLRERGEITTRRSS
ncbi:hypothetical protein HPP92_010903 [Vanilla planifolia]|uniref:Alpha/beta hydrolase fold-3 domain-containing protein n=1 Tax=Vanilla planifolia TaxID=51239 RepID=A0A835R612_VANPL|nr:hypothetical protein HPP92_010903 [Vanilla planifolia]